MSQQKNHQSRLIEAIRIGRVSSVTAALDNGADIEEPDMHGCRGLPLRVACFSGDLGVIRELLQRGADVNAPAHDGPGAPMRLALRRGHKDVISLLLQYGAAIPEGVKLDIDTLGNISSEALVSKAEGPLLPLALTEESSSLPSFELPELALPQTETLETDAPGNFGDETRLIGMDLLFLEETPGATEGQASDPNAGFWKTGNKINT